MIYFHTLIPYWVFHFNIWYLTCRPKFKHYALPKYILTLDLNAQKIKSCSINTACMIWSYVRCTPKKSLYLFATLRLCWFKYGNRYQIFIVVLNDHALVIYVIWNNNFFINQFYHILIQNRLLSNIDYYLIHNQCNNYAYHDI